MWDRQGEDTKAHREGVAPAEPLWSPSRAAAAAGS